MVGPSGEEIHTDEHGRIKVQFHWDREGKNDENSSCWVRVAQIWAGKNWGVVHIPRIGQEVIVDFIEGNPDCPIIIGRVYHGANKPPRLMARLAEGSRANLVECHVAAGSGVYFSKLETEAGVLLEKMMLLR